MKRKTTPTRANNHAFLLNLPKGKFREFQKKARVQDDRTASEQLRVLVSDYLKEGSK